MEHTLTTRKSPLKKSFPQNKEAFSYSGLPVIPFIAPRTNKLKINALVVQNPLFIPGVLQLDFICKRFRVAHSLRNVNPAPG